MLNFIKNFRADEDGAGLGIAVLTTVSGGAEDLAGDIGDELTAIDPGAGV
ncbi:MAG: hypothetical protein NTX73_16690 [Rhodobacterales bacterium]|nr:hypothetical protein [Rhodobacterales bacterium]